MPSTKVREPGGLTSGGRRTRGGFALLGAVQMTLIFTLASLAVPLPASASSSGSTGPG